jgi:hypothetical protein
VGDEFAEGGAFGSAILGVGVVVVKAGAVAEDAIAFDFSEAELAAGILVDVAGFIGVLAEFINLKAAHVLMRIFALVIPFHEDAGLDDGADEINGLCDDIQAGGVVTGDPNFRFDPKLDDHQREFCEGA